jgi:hypothetical protein
MENNKLLTQLFPDTSVRNAVLKVLRNKSAHGEAMSTDYSFFDDKNKLIYASAHRPCFGSLYVDWRAHKVKSKYMSYLPKYSQTCSKENRLRWIELGQEMDILDDSVSPQHIHTNGILIDMKDENLTIGELYLKLTFMRWLREAPVLVNNIITLVDEAGRDFWAAACFCHGDNVSRVDHSLLPYKTGYPVGGHRTDVERDLGLIMRMHKVATTPRLTDTRKVVTQVNSGTGSFHWQWHAKTVKPEKNLIVKDKLMLLSSELHPLIYSGSVTKAAEMIKTLKLRKSHVQFVEE